MVRDRGVRGSVVSVPWEENAHALRKPARAHVAREVASEVQPAEAVVGRRETSGPPVTPQGALSSMRFRAAKVARVSWEHTRCGCTQFDWVADVG